MGFTGSAVGHVTRVTGGAVGHVTGVTGVFEVFCCFPHVTRVTGGALRVYKYQ